MLNNIKKLSHFYNLIIICNDASSLKKLIPEKILLIEINFRRKPNIYTDFFFHF